jgi:hypothetical protein
MKFVYCTCSVSVSERVVAILEENGVNDYQMADNVIARSVVGNPRFNTPVWPGYNVVITMQFSNDERAGEILDILRQFNSATAFNDDEMLTVCSWKMDDYFFN